MNNSTTTKHTAEPGDEQQEAEWYARKYRGIARRMNEHFVCVTMENDCFYLPCTRKQAIECINAGMVAVVHRNACYIDKVDHDRALGG